MVSISKGNKDLSWRLLYEIKNTTYLDRLFELYASDKDKARIYYYLNKDNGKFVSFRVLLFEYKNGDFRIVRLQKVYGISITNRMYSHEKNIDSISYSKKSGFHHSSMYNTRHVRQLNYTIVRNFINNCNFNEGTDEIYNYLVSKFGWIRNIKESTFWNLSFNTIQRKRLYSTKAILRHVFGCPYPQAKLVYDHTMQISGDYLKAWKEQKKNLDNIESLTSELFYHPLFMDSCKMAQMVNKKVNCSWSVKRLKSEHDKWSKMITEVLLETEPLRDLRVGAVFIEFAKHSGFELLTTNHALIEEGVRMNHCVGTYSSRVDSGLSGIYRAFGYTLEMVLVKDSSTGIYIFKIGQYMNISNTKVPDESYDIVCGLLETFKTSNDFSKEYEYVVDRFEPIKLDDNEF